MPGDLPRISKGSYVNFLARMIRAQRWEPGPGEGEIAADAVTSDLRTKDNELSMWLCSGNEDLSTLEAVALALAAGFERTEKLQLVWIGKDELLQAGISLATTKGNTPVSSLSDRHVDLKGLDYVRLGSVAKLVSEAVARNHIHLFREQQVVKLLANAIKTNALNAADLKAKVRTSVESELAKS